MQTFMEPNSTHLHGTKGDADYLTHEDPRGAGEHTQESGKTIRHLTQEEGQVT